MSEFERDLTNVIGNFINTELDYIEKSSNELEEVAKEKDLYKEVIEEVRECFENNFLESTLEAFVCLRKEDYENLKDKLDKVKENKND